MCPTWQVIFQSGHVLIFSAVYMTTFMPEAGISNFEQNEILVSGHLSIWHLVFDKSRYLKGIYLFSKSVLKKRYLRNRHEVWCQKQISHVLYISLWGHIEIPASGTKGFFYPWGQIGDTCLWHIRNPVSVSLKQCNFEIPSSGTKGFIFHGGNWCYLPVA